MIRLTERNADGSEQPLDVAQDDVAYVRIAETDPGHRTEVGLKSRPGMPFLVTESVDEVNQLMKGTSIA